MFMWYESAIPLSQDLLLEAYETMSKASSKEEIKTVQSIENSSKDGINGNWREGVRGKKPLTEPLINHLILQFNAQNDRENLTASFLV